MLSHGAFRQLRAALTENLRTTTRLTQGFGRRNMHSSDTYSGEGFVNTVKALSNVRIWLLLLFYVAGGARLCPAQAGIAGGDMPSTVRLPAVEAEDSQGIHEHSSSKASDKTTSDQKSEEDQKSEKKDEKDKKKKELAVHL